MRKFFDYFQNGLLYVTHVTHGYGDEGDETYDMLNYEEQSGKLTVVEKGFRPLAMSPDKSTIFGYMCWKGIFQKYDISSRALYPPKEKRLFGFSGSNEYMPNITFLNNNIIIGPPSANISIRMFYDIDGEHIGDVFLFPEGKPGTIYDIGFSDDFKYAVIHYTYKGYGGVALVDSSPFLDWLLEKNMLFIPTTAVSTKNSIRIRENPQHSKRRPTATSRKAMSWR